MNKALIYIGLWFTLTSLVIAPEGLYTPEHSFVYAPIAFEGAYGAGSSATGGRGFPVYEVTNLNNSGPGSLRDALSAGNRTIVFTVSGIIKLTSALTVTGDNITIAGQTAPVGGITITGDDIQDAVDWNGDNAIIRFVHFRPVFDPQGTHDGVPFDSGNKNIIIDHCSFSWGGDEVISFVGSSSDQPDNITFSRNIVYKGWKGHIIGYSKWIDDGRIARPTGDFSWLSNMYAHTSHRVTGNFVTDDRVDIINNVVHNWYERMATMRATSDADINYINNYHSGGCRSVDPATAIIAPPHTTENIYFNSIDYEPGDGIPDIYPSGNVYAEYPGAAQVGLFRWYNDAEPGKVNGEAIAPSWLASTAYPQLGNTFSVLSAADAKNDLVNGGAGAVWVLNENGAKVSDIDAIDQNAINDVDNNTCIAYTYQGAAWQNSTEYINYRATITGVPINIHSASRDSDNDGMPDPWEITRFGNIAASNGQTDTDSSGWTDLEDFLNLAGKPGEGSGGSSQGSAAKSKKIMPVIIN